jgi:hypothetical protein
MKNIVSTLAPPIEPFGEEGHRNLIGVEEESWGYAHFFVPMGL